MKPAVILIFVILLGSKYSYSQGMTKPKYILYYKSELASPFDGHIMSYSKKAYYINDNEGYITTESYTKPIDSAKRKQFMSMNLKEDDIIRLEQTLKITQEYFDNEFTYFNFVSSQSIKHIFDSEKKDYFDVIDSTRDIMWNIIDSFKVYENLKTQFAKGIDQNNNKYEAWFTHEIPVSIGPLTIRGLPGLILEVVLIDSKNDRKYFSVSKIVLESEKMHDFSKYTFSKVKMSQTDFSKRAQDQLNNLKLMNQNN